MTLPRGVDLTRSKHIVIAMEQHWDDIDALCQLSEASVLLAQSRLEDKDKGRELYLKIEARITQLRNLLCLLLILPKKKS